MAKVALKRKNIDLPVEVIKKLAIVAATKGMSIKAYMEQILIAKANTIEIKVTEKPEEE